MDAKSVCAPLLAEPDALSLTTSTPHAASVTDADKVININIDSNQVEGAESQEELPNGLLTDSYCHVCEAVLLFKSQRLSHYEGKKHAQKLRVYLQTKRAEKVNKEAAGAQQTMSTDKDHFCELCNMVFSSPVVARSHYEGKVHTKNLRKQGLLPPVIDRYPEVHSRPSLCQNPDNAVQKSSQEGVVEPQNPTASVTAPSTDVDLTDPNKYCVLCAASFNNPQMALQHYNGRKHQRNQSRHELLKELGDNVQQANRLICQLCGVQFNSVEMYQAHMQGNKHQIREKKVIDLCKSQQKVYNTFADELSDYIQIQKARGIAQRPSALPPGAPQNDDDGERDGKVLTERDVVPLHKPLTNFPPSYNPPHHSRYNPSEGGRPSYQGRSWPPHGLVYSGSPPVFPGSGSPLFPVHPMTKKRRRRPSSSSSHTSSSSYSSSYSSSSSSSSTSDSDDTKHRRKERRRIRRSRRERDKRTKEEEEDKEDKRRKRQRRERHQESEEGRRGESGVPEEERRRKGNRDHGKHKRREKKAREDLEAAGEGSLKREEVMHDRKETGGQVQAEMNVEQRDSGQDEPGRAKNRREKKKEKIEKEDTRTEEEKLWDDSILGF